MTVVCMNDQDILKMGVVLGLQNQSGSPLEIRFSELSEWTHLTCSNLQNAQAVLLNTFMYTFTSLSSLYYRVVSPRYELWFFRTNYSLQQLKSFLSTGKILFAHNISTHPL